MGASLAGSSKRKAAMLRTFGIRASKGHSEHYDLYIGAAPEARQPTFITLLSRAELQELVRTLAVVAFNDHIKYSDSGEMVLPPRRHR